jgi:hypothetical protein
MDNTEQAKAKRDLAARARRWARGLSQTAERQRLERHADELEREAAELERQAATAAFVPPRSRTVMQMQTQQQQQREIDSKDDDHRP